MKADAASRSLEVSTATPLPVHFMSPALPAYRAGLRFHGGDDPALRLAIESAIGRVFGVGQADLFRKSRGRASTALARQVAMYLANVACGLSFTEVGRLFGRDRTTVAHACALIEDRRDEESFDRTIELLEWVVPTLASPMLRFPEADR